MAVTTQELINVPLSPAAPEDLYFSEGRQAWIASQYRDVLAALRSADLSQCRAPSHRETAEPIIAPRLQRSPPSKWQLQAKQLASALLRDMPGGRSVDLVSEFIRPWCLASALALTGIDAAHSERLGELVTRLFESDAAPDNLTLKARAREANSQLDCIFQTSSTSSYKSMFLGAAQTVPTFIASAWAALLQHPLQITQLREHPGCMPKAVEELLRYAGPVHTVFRQAQHDVDISGAEIRGGDRLILRLASANRDPRQFHDPERLDITRDVAGHLALSFGPHYCSGALVVRWMTEVSIGAVLAHCSELRLCRPVEWFCGTMLVWPSSLPVVLGSAQ